MGGRLIIDHSIVKRIRDNSIVHFIGRHMLAVILCVCVLPSLKNSGPSTYAVSILLLGIWLVSYKYKKVRAVCLLGLVITLLLIPMGLRIAKRSSGVMKGTHDGLLQTEYATSLILEGRNLYHEDTAKSVFPPPHDKLNIQFGDKHEETIVNPALYHFVYPPLYFLQFVPAYWIFETTFHWFDLRICLLLYLMATVLLIWRQPLEHSFKTAMCFLLFLNPYFLTYFIEGRNDIVVLFWLLWSFLLLHERRYQFAVWTIVVACSVKQTAWIITPFLMVYLLHNLPWKTCVRMFLLPVALALSIVLPFLIWDPSGLWMDMIMYPSGKLATSYPVNGYSLLAQLVRFGILYSPLEYYPISYVQIPFYVLVLWMTNRVLVRHCTVSAMTFCASIGIAVFWFFSRFYNDNYVEFTASIVVVSWMFWKLEQRKSLSLQGCVPISGSV